MTKARRVQARKPRSNSSGSIGMSTLWAVSCEGMPPGRSRNRSSQARFERPSSAMSSKLSAPASTALASTSMRRCSTFAALRGSPTPSRHSSNSCSMTSSRPMAQGSYSSHTGLGGLLSPGSPHALALGVRGRHRGRPRLRRTPGTTSSTEASGLPSWRFAPLNSKPSGVPRAQARRWHLRSPAGRGRWGSARSWSPATSAPFCRDGRGSSIESPSRSSAQASANRSRSTRCRSPSAPAACQSRRRRQHIGPVQPKTSRGSRSQPMPDQGTNTMASRARRSSHRGRPPFGFGGSGGSSGATAAHNSSLTRGLVITPTPHAQIGPVRGSKPCLGHPCISTARTLLASSVSTPRGRRGGRGRWPRP